MAQRTGGRGAAPRRGGQPSASRRGVLHAAVGVGALVAAGGLGMRALDPQGLGDQADQLRDATRPLAQPSCADPRSLVRRPAVGRATLVYEVDQRPAPLLFEAGFHRQLAAWLAEWDATSGRGATTELWGYGAYVPKDQCRSWHAAGRALDISRLRRGDSLLVSCRTDLWAGLPPARRRALEGGYWRLAASLNLHFSHVLTHHFDAAHANHIHVDNGVSGDGLSRFRSGSRAQNQSVQAICRTVWGAGGEVGGDWGDTRRMAGPVLDRLGLRDLRRTQDWHAFLRASASAR